MKLIQELIQLNEAADKLRSGDPIIITGHGKFSGKTGDFVRYAEDGMMAIVRLYNYGEQKIAANDVARNDYADELAEGEVSPRASMKVPGLKITVGDSGNPNWRKKVSAALEKLGYDIEAQGLSDGSTSYSFLVALKKNDTREKVIQKLRDELKFDGWMTGTHYDLAKLDEDARMKLDGQDAYIVAARGAMKHVPGLNMQTAKVLAKFAMGELAELPTNLQQKVEKAYSGELPPADELLQDLLVAGSRKQVKEDWGSSDWTVLFNSIQKMLDKGETADYAVDAAAEMYYDDLGHPDIEDAIAEILRIAKLRKHKWVKDIKMYKDLMESPLNNNLDN